VAYSDLSGTLDALRGGTDVVGRHKVRFVAARVVRDVTADGTQKQGARSRETVTRSALTDAADDGWCTSHSRYLWGFRLTRSSPPDGTPRALQLTSAEVDERDVALIILERCQRQGGETLAGRQGLRRPTVRRPSRATGRYHHAPRPQRGVRPRPHLAPIRHRIESIFWTCKDLLTSSATAPEHSQACANESSPDSAASPQPSPSMTHSAAHPCALVNYCP
jgi:hypothetical protein